MPNTKESNKGASNATVLKTMAGVAIGAAVAFGAYFLGKADGHEEAQHSYQKRVTIAQNMTPHSAHLEKCDVDDDDKIARDCDICKRSFKRVMAEGEEIHSTPCGHIFCKCCIELTLQARPKCPICNNDVLPNQTHRIYL